VNVAPAVMKTPTNLSVAVSNTGDPELASNPSRSVVKESAIAVSLLIQTLQIIPVTILGVAMAPEFLLRRTPKIPETTTGAL